MGRKTTLLAGTLLAVLLPVVAVAAVAGVVSQEAEATWIPTDEGVAVGCGGTVSFLLVRYLTMVKCAGRQPVLPRREPCAAATTPAARAAFTTGRAAETATPKTTT
jgi:hypothetical protein